MHLRLRGDALGGDDLLFERVKRRFGGREGETLAVERHLHHTPASEVDGVVLDGELVDVGGLARHGRGVLRKVDALPELGGGETADCLAVDFQRVVAGGQAGDTQALLIEGGEKV